MEDCDSEGSRRRFLRLAGGASVVGLAGCIGTEEAPTGDARPADWCLDELEDEVPEALATAESIDGIERDPENVRPKEDVAYQCSSEGYQLCANCQFFVPPAGDYVGACTEVAGEIASQHWCGIYQPTERLEERPDNDPLNGE